MHSDSSLFWNAQITAIRIGANSITKTGFTSAWSLNGTTGASKPVPIVFDTGTSFIYIPRNYANDIFYRLLYGKKYVKYSDGSVGV